MVRSSEGLTITARLRSRARSTATAVLLFVLVSAWSATAVSADGSARVISHGPRAERLVALTFDDGWGRSSNDRILAVLIAEKVPATFFPYALAVRGNPAFWKRVAKAGFPIANHSWSHPYFPSLSQHEMEWQISASRRLIEQVTGVPMVRVFRPPYGAYDSRVLAAAANQGFPTVLLWDASAGDTGAWHTYGSVLRGATSGTNGSIVLLHAGPAVTADVLSQAIRSYRTRGFRFVTVPELLGRSAALWPTPTPTSTPGPTPTPGPTTSPAPTPTPTATPFPTGAPVPTPGPTTTPTPVPSPTSSTVPGPTSTRAPSSARPGRGPAARAPGAPAPPQVWRGAPAPPQVWRGAPARDPVAS